MRILIAGTGAVGGYFGARLADAGHDVVFFARGRNLAALREGGLTVGSVDGDLRLPRVAATDALAGTAPVELALVTVKSYDTAATAAAIAPVVTPETIVLSLQNGIENESLLASALGLPPLLGAMTQIGAELTAPGVVRHVAQGTIYFGELTGHESPRTRTLVELFTAAAIRHRCSRQILLMLWDKLSWNAAFNAVTALTRTTSGAAARLPATARLLRAAMLEVIAVARAQGILLDPARVDGVVAYAGEHLGELRTSMLQDVERGGRLEHDAINGAVVRIGEAVGVPTPLNATLVALLSALDLARTHPGGDVVVIE
ncbi:MAG: ketopantoate reductase family protein [Deltaproteobacteria bacterium]|nr:ketopantoate reductase family protein [Deltaproteobacteria bacterium]